MLDLAGLDVAGLDVAGPDVAGPDVMVPEAIVPDVILGIDLLSRGVQVVLSPSRGALPLCHRRLQSCHGVRGLDA